MTSLIALPALLLAFALDVAEPSPVRVYDGSQGRLAVAVPRDETPLEIDGVLDEPAWERAACLTGFSLYSPIDGRAAEQPTEVRVFYSPSAIFFGVRAQAPPGTVRASLANRDQLAAEDTVTIFLSTFNDGRQALVFTVNALGVQSDGTLVEGTQLGSGHFSSLASEREPPDLSPDFVFQSRGRLTESGFEVELRIPFQSLRYQKADVQSWGLHVVRKVQSTGYEESWAPARRSAASFLAQGGTLEGLTGLRPGLVLDVNPFVTARADGERAVDGWSYGSRTAEAGGNVRWGMTPNLTLNGTLNPDFSQVEADAGQFQYDPREAVYFPEKRPFFLDGLEQFGTPNQLVYTRRVVAPLFAAKITGKASGTNLGLLSAVDEVDPAGGTARPIFNVVRVQRDLRGQSKLGLVYTDKVAGADFNRVGGLDARLTFADVYSLRLQGALSHTRRAHETTTAPLFEVVANRNGRRFGNQARITGIDDGFEAQAGFISRPGVVRASFDQRVSFFGRAGARLESWSTDLVLSGRWPYDAFFGEGGIQDRQLHLNNNLRLRGGWKAGASVLVESFGYDRALYADYALAGDQPGELLPFAGTPTLPNLDYVLSLDTPEFRRFSGNASLLWGRDDNFFEWASADIVYLTAVANFRPAEKVRLDAEYRLQQFRRRTDGSLVARRQLPRLRLEYQAARFVFLRLVAEYDAQLRDALRDDSRSGRPILVLDADSGRYEPALRQESNRLRLDVLFSWQPTPGTVFFAGYGSSLHEPEPMRFSRLARQRDGFFVKFSYLFRI